MPWGSLGGCKREKRRGLVSLFRPCLDTGLNLPTLQNRVRFTAKLPEKWYKAPEGRQLALSCCSLGNFCLSGLYFLSDHAVSICRERQHARGPQATGPSVGRAPRPGERGPEPGAESSRTARPALCGPLLPRRKPGPLPALLRPRRLQKVLGDHGGLGRPAGRFSCWGNACPPSFMMAKCLPQELAFKLCNH